MKKFISLLLVALMVVSSFAVVGNAAEIREEETYTLGDANDDAAVDARDSLYIKRYNANALADEINENGADIVADGKITAKDELALKKIVAQVDDVSKYDNGESVSRFTIAGNDISEYEIVLLPNSATYNENANYAAMQLQRYILEATGVYVNDVTTADPSKRHITFVDVTGTELESELEIENYKYEVVDGELNIYGTNRGNMYAVWEILEDYLGYYFVRDTFIITYTDRYVDIPEGTTTFRHPWLEFRICKQSFNSQGVDGTEVHYFPRRLNGTQIYTKSEPYYGTLTGPVGMNAHSYGYYWRMATGTYSDVDSLDAGYTMPKSEYGTTYYEKYKGGFQQNEGAWNPCFTSDEEYDILFRGMLEYMRMYGEYGWGNIWRKDRNSISFSICDNGEICSCQSCKKISDDGQYKDWVTGEMVDRLASGGSGLTLWLANRAARDIRMSPDDPYYEENNTYRPASWIEYGDGDIEGSPTGYGEIITDYYPDMKIYTIFYSHDMPNQVLPEKNIVLMYCGFACNNHIAGSGDCGQNYNYLGSASFEKLPVLEAWSNLCHEIGAEMWFWYYPVNYNMKLVDTPNIPNLYYDIKYLVEKCNIKGIYYEGSYGDGEGDNVFESLKAHMAAVMMWSVVENEDGTMSCMSYEEYCAEIKKYLKVFYGEGYEYIYQFIDYMTAAGDATGNCFINNFDRPGDMFDYYYIQENYEDMRAVLVAARAMVKDPTSSVGKEQLMRIDKLMLCCDLLGLTTVHELYYVNGTPELKQLYMDRYTWFYNYIIDNDVVIYGTDIYKMPDEINFEIKPMTQLYESGSWRIWNKDTWGWDENTMTPPGWGFQPA